MDLNLLVVEDDGQLVSIWKDKIEMYNVEDDRIFNILEVYVDNLDGALKEINSVRFDVVVIDVRLKSGNPQANRDGNEVLKAVVGSTISLVAMCTAETGIVEIEDGYKGLVRVFEKGSGSTDVHDEILNWIDSEKKIVESMKVVHDDTKQEMAKLFYKSIWPRWQYWVRDDGGKDTINAALKRHLATHLHATFINEVESVHAEEHFFIPPLSERIDTGDIIREGDSYYIVVNPRCDLAQGKNSTFQLVFMELANTEWNRLNEALDQAKAITPVATKKINTAEQQIRKFTNHKDRTSKYHYIPGIRMDSTSFVGPFFADFSRLESREAEDGLADDLLSKRVASLSNEFVPSIVERLGAYFSRIGTPDFSSPQ